MAFDIEKTIADMFGAMSGVISDMSPDVQACVKERSKRKKKLCLILQWHEKITK